MSCVWIKFLLLSSFISLAQLVTLKCNFEMDAYKDYTCFAKNFEITSKDDQTITEVSGVHLEGKSNADVKAFGVKDTTIKFFPKDLAKYFPKLEIVDIENSELSEITKSDLEQFGENLRTLFLAENDIENIDQNTFQSNPQLNSINLDGNHIKYVDSGAFTKLKNLVALQFENNVCFSKSIRDVAEKTSIVGRKIEKECTKNNEKNIVRNMHDQLNELKDVIEGLLDRLRI